MEILSAACNFPSSVAAAAVPGMWSGEGGERRAAGTRAEPKNKSQKSVPQCLPSTTIQPVPHCLPSKDSVPQCFPNKVTARGLGFFSLKVSEVSVRVFSKHTSFQNIQVHCFVPGPEVRDTNNLLYTDMGIFAFRRDVPSSSPSRRRR